MAHLHEDVIYVKVSKLMKGDHEECDNSCDLSQELIASIEDVVQELLGDPSLIVEVSIDHQH